MFVTNIRTFGPLSLITSILITAIMFVLGLEPLELENEGLPSAYEIVFIIASVVVTMLTSIAIIKTVADPMENDLTDLYRFAVRTFPAYVWVSILMGLSIMIGFVLFIVPGIYLLISFAFAALIVVLEGAGGVEALKRSRAYVKGYWFNVFRRYAFLLFVGLSMLLVLEIFFGSTLKAFENSYWYSVLMGTLGTLVTCFTTSYTYLMYTDLKNAQAAQPDQDVANENIEASTL
jgi:hypothetical protein